MHVHNFFPMLSPAIYDAARAAGIPVVQTLHNYRLLCPNGLLLRNDRPCEDCRDRLVKWPGVLHRCYRGSRGASAAAAAMAGLHRWRGTWADQVDRYLALTPFARDRFVAGGLPAQRIAVSPVAMPDPGPAAWDDGRQGALYVGRLSPEKGLDTLLDAWTGIDLPLTIIGDGPLRAALAGRAPPHVTIAGPADPAGVAAAMARAALLVFPSLAYENFPLAVVEAMARGLPVLASRRGAMADMIEDGVSGAFAAPGDAAGWRAAAATLLADRPRLARLAAGARAGYVARYHPDRVLAGRLALYRDLCAGRS
jgi:glycosyltransferase involved in cell wall biosynthesis